MFEIVFNRNLLTKDPGKKGKITGISIYHGYHCGTYFKCPHGQTCKYRKAHTFHNLSVKIHRWFELYLHIKLPHWFYMNKRYTDLSGTTKCPHSMHRFYTCYNCIFQEGDRGCENKSRLKFIEEFGYLASEDEKNPYICKFFLKNEWADNYDKNTGRTIWEEIK